MTHNYDEAYHTWCMHNNNINDVSFPYTEYFYSYISVLQIIMNYRTMEMLFQYPKIISACIGTISLQAE